MNTQISNIKVGKKELLKSISLYAATGIIIEILDIDNNTATVKINQSKLINGYILNKIQLVERVKEAFKPTGLKTKVIPVVYSLNVDEITVDWINDRMNEFGIKRNDLIKQLALDKSYISRLFSDGKNSVELSKPMKATFFYYFLAYELNRDLRGLINNE